MNPFADSMNPYLIIGLAVVLLVIIILVIRRIFHNLKLVQQHHNEQVSRVQHLKLHHMLEHLGIPFKHYLKKTTDLQRERHIWACENCPKPDDCKRVLDDGEPLDLQNICPNHERLKPLQKHSQ